MTQKHTPGPWKVYERVSNHDSDSWIKGPDGEQIASGIGHEDEPQQLANARLIAAAPELLEALQDLVGWGGLATLLDEGIRASVKGDRVWVNARAVIAKATGEQS